ncbi:MAG: EndoU domain-containing protein [Limnohabitans sp.]|nr:EndoU domain-containing protein [Limnohabitans sp.]
MDNINGIPLIWDEEGDKKLFGNLFPKSLQYISNTPIESIRTRKSFEEISYETRFGENNSCGEYVDNWYSKAIDVNELLRFIYDKIPYKSSFYYPQRYILSSLSSINPNSPFLTMNVGLYNAISSEKKTFTYDDRNIRRRNQGDVYIKLNARACEVNLSKPGFRFKIDTCNKEISFMVSYIYQDALDKGVRNFNNETLATNDYNEIDKKYYAIILECKDANSFAGLTYYIEHESFVKENITNVFIDAIKKATTKEELKFLYENIPDFAIANLKFTEELLWSHLVELTHYDDVGVFSGWRDGSSALINILKAFGDSIRLYKTFKKNPAFIKRLYKNLDGKSVFNEQVVSNKLIFANLITALCINNGFKGLNKVDKAFEYGKEYKFDADIFSWLSDEKEDEFFLKQKITIEEEELQIYPDDLVSKAESKKVRVKKLVDAEKGQMYHPLDLVRIIDMDSKDKTPITVPAIYIKALSDEVELQEIETNIRIGFDILAIVLGIITVTTTANPAVLALACADIGLAAIDGGIQVYKTEILKLEGGEEFLETWEKIYVIGGLVLAGPTLVQTALTTGAKVLRLAQMAKNSNAAHFIKTCLLKVLVEIEIANFTKNTVKILEKESELISATRGVLDAFTVGELYEKGLFVVMGEVKIGDKIEQQVSIIYKDEIIITANQFNFSKASYQLLKNLANEKRFFEECEELYSLKHLSKDVIKHADIGEFSGVNNPKKSTLPGKMRVGGHGQANIDFLEQIGRKYKIEHTYQNGVRIGAVDGHDNKYKRLVDAIRNTDQSWFPKNWDAKKIKDAGRFVIENNYEKFKTAKDGMEPIFDNFDGVRVGVMKTNGKPATIFPDNAKQPLINGKDFEINPFK